MHRVFRASDLPPPSDLRTSVLSFIEVLYTSKCFRLRTSLHASVFHIPGPPAHRGSSRIRSHTLGPPYIRVFIIAPFEYRTFAHIIFHVWGPHTAPSYIKPHTSRSFIHHSLRTSKSFARWSLSFIGVLSYIAPSAYRNPSHVGPFRLSRPSNIEILRMPPPSIEVLPYIEMLRMPASVHRGPPRIDPFAPSCIGPSRASSRPCNIEVLRIPASVHRGPPYIDPFAPSCIGPSRPSRPSNIEMLRMPVFVRPSRHRALSYVEPPYIGPLSRIAVLHAPALATHANFRPLRTSRSSCTAPSQHTQISGPASDQFPCSHMNLIRTSRISSSV